MIEIEVRAPGSEPRTVRFDVLPVRIGRGSENDLVIDESTLSRRHAEIRADGAKLHVVDCGSRNGVLRGGAKVSDVELADGDELTIGSVVLRVRLPAAAPAGVWFLVHDTRRGLRHLKLAPGVEYVIGRSPSADVVLDDRSVSREHARIAVEGGRPVLRDANTPNGCFVNDRRVAEAPLAEGDRLTVGGTSFTVQRRAADVRDEAALLEGTRVLQRPEPTAPATAPTAFAETVASRKVIVAAVAVVAIVAAAAAYRFVAGRPPAPPVVEGGPAAAPAKTLRVEAVPAVRKEVLATVSTSGAVRPAESVTLAAEVAGRILELPIEENRSIAAGDLVAVINPRDLELQIAEARSALRSDQLRLSREDAARKKRLFDQGVVTRSVYEQAKNANLALESSHEAAAARVRLLEEQRGKTRIAASLGGVVSRRFVNVGELVAPGTPIASIVDLSEVLIEADVSDRDVVRIRSGQTVVARTAAYPDRVFTGEVERVASTANPATRTYGVTARLANEDTALKGGMIVALELRVGAVEALVVPLDAVLEDDGTRIFVVRDGRARRVTVTVESQSDGEAAITGALEVGEPVVVVGQAGLEDGHPVEIDDRTAGE